MEEYTQITLDQWMEWKEGIRKKLQETAGNFVYIGYCLRKLRDSGDLYEQEECEDIFEFAKKEYGLDKSTVSRFIAINEKYSEGGYSMELQDKYKGYGQSQLVEMLTLPDSEIDLITEKATVKEIRELKRFDKEEREEIMNPPVEPEETLPFPEAGSDGEDAAAGGEKREWTPLQECIIDFFKDKRELLEEVEKAYTIRDASELVAPSGNRTHRKGSVFLLMYDYDKGVAYRKMGLSDPVKMSWDDFYNEIDGIFLLHKGEMDIEWDSVYGQEKAAPTACQPAEPVEVWEEPVHEDARKEPDSEGVENGPENDQKGAENDQKEAESVTGAPENVRNEPESVPEPVATSQRDMFEEKPIRLESRWSIGRMKTIQNRYDTMLHEVEGIKERLGDWNWPEARSLAEALAAKAARMMEEDQEELKEALDQLLED